MESTDLTAYYEKLSEIRSKVLNKHRDKSAHSSYKYNNENIVNTKPYQGDRYKEKEYYELRKPLEDRDQREANVLDRVRELDSVNEKIKLILAAKRQPSSSSSHQRVNSSYRRSIQANATPKKMTSLFQNQKNIVESKVLPQNTWAKSKEKRIYEPQINESYYKKTYEQSKFESFQQRESKREDKSIQKEVEFPKTSRYFQTIFPSKSDAPVTKERDTFSFNLKQNDVEPLLTAKFPCTFEGSRTQISGYLDKPVTKRLLQVIIKQIELDSKLREAKQKYHNFKSKDKLKILKEKLIASGVKFGQRQIQDWVYISTEECNPFFEITHQDSFDFDELATRMIASWAYWNNNVKEAATISGLENEGFKIQEIDLSGKGFITIEDFVCFINLNSDSSFRNRDVFNMFRRWNQSTPNSKLQNRLEYETFLNFISK